jgi:hypothetical protein
MSSARSIAFAASGSSPAPPLSKIACAYAASTSGSSGCCCTTIARNRRQPSAALARISAVRARVDHASQ